jgi:protein-arginine kinase activator protein McsA
MSEVLEFHISCPQCNYSNTATSSISKYKEIVYQPCNDDVGLQDHNVKDQMSCDNCYDTFEFYWCAGHKMVENNAGSGR